MKNVVLTYTFPICRSFLAKASVKRFLKPLPRPMSKIYIHDSTELKVSQTPYSYGLRYPNVRGTRKKDIKMEQPFKKADAMIFLAASFERASFEFLNLVRMSLMGFILMTGCQEAAERAGRRVEARWWERRSGGVRRGEEARREWMRSSRRSAVSAGM